MKTWNDRKLTIHFFPSHSCQYTGKVSNCAFLLSFCWPGMSDFSISCARTRNLFTKYRNEPITVFYYNICITMTFQRCLVRYTNCRIQHGEEQHKHKHIHSNVWLRGRFRLVYGNTALSLIRPALLSRSACGATCLEVKWIAPLKFDGERGHGSMRYLSSKQTVTKGQAKCWKAGHGCTYEKKNVNFTHSTSSKQNPPV